MAYLSLYRKYRPQTFDEVVGQDHVTRTLARAVDEGQIHHAYLFTGPRGTGKTSTARILAKAVNCEHGPTSRPDGTCDQCRAITTGSALDVVEIDAASHGGVDDVRELRERVALAPVAARTKVYIVDECHMLSTAGWNAFLKTVEEPPGHVMFVFATTEPQKVLATILSRTQRFDFRRVATATLVAHVHELAGREGLTVEPGAAEQISLAGDGSVRDTLSVMEQVASYAQGALSVAAVTDVLGAVPTEQLLAVGDLVGDGDVGGLCTLVQQLTDQGTDLRQFAREAVEHFRALMLLQAAPDAGLVEGTPERVEQLRAQAQRLGRIEVLRAVQLLADCQALMRRGATRLPLELALVRAALPEASGDPAALAARLDRIERRAQLPVAGDPGASSDAGSVAPAPMAPVTSEPTAPVAPVAPVESEPTAPGMRADEDAAPADEAAPDATQAPIAAAPVDLDLVRREWPAVLGSVKGRSRRLHAQLAEGEVDRVQGGLVVVGFRALHRFHAGEVGDARWADLFAEVLREVFGAPLRLQAVVHADDGVVETPSDTEPPGERSREAADVAESEAAEAAGDVPDPDRAYESAIAALQRGLGAQVVTDP